MRVELKTPALLMALVASVAMSGCSKAGSAGAISSKNTSSLNNSQLDNSQLDNLQPSVEVTDSNGMRPGVFPTTRVEAPPEAERGDGPPPTPDSELTAAEILGLITLPASAPASPDSCAPGEVRVSLAGIDAAAGHRYAQLIATNISNRPCSLLGWPGLGLRGEWGTPFPTIPERSTLPVNRVGVPEADADAPVTLKAEGSAAAELEWTGALAGTYDEPVSLIAVQFTVDAIPAVLLVDTADHVDLGPESTVRVGPWGSAG